METKVCGLTRLNDLRVAERAGADYLGMIVEIARSPRSLALATASLLARAARRRVVVVVADEDLPRCAEIAGRTGAFALQLHGDETIADISALRAALPRRVELWRALSLPPVLASDQLDATVSRLVDGARRLADSGIARIVLDNRVGGLSGGTGLTCDWTAAAAVVAACPLPVMLAGGLTPDNVAEAIAAVRPAGIDASSGVERAPGIKCPAAIQLLIARAR